MENLKRIRKARGLTQEELGNIVGVSKSSISQYESGNKTPSFEIALKLAEALDCESADLVSARDIIANIKQKIATINNVEEENKKTPSQPVTVDSATKNRHDYVNSLFDQLTFENQIDSINFLKMKLQSQSVPGDQKESD